jgi:hypothetical protein
MRINFPKDTAEVHWTSHVKRKMAFYGLSEQRIRGVMRNPKRSENGIAPQTVAAMQRNDKPKRKEEVWVMFTKHEKHRNIEKKKQTIVISAWRYPGISKKKEIPMPEGVAEELEKFMNQDKF